MGIASEDIRDIIMSHMEDQPYNIACSRCGKNLSCSTDVDGDFDLKLDVEPCDDCMASEKSEGYEEGKEEGVE